MVPLSALAEAAAAPREGVSDPSNCTVNRFFLTKNQMTR